MQFKLYPFLSALFFVFGIIHSISAQKPINYQDFARIGGQIVDAETGEPLPYAQINNIYKHPQKDSTVVHFSITDAEGKFTITTPRVVQNRIEVVCMGYKLFERPITEIKIGILQDPIAMAKVISLGKLKMEPDVQQLDEVVVRSRIKLYEMHGDTTYIFPKLVKVGKGEPLIELLRRHPMFDVKENGDVYFDGKFIERIKLNEKLLFGEDARAAVTSLLAEDAQLIKAYDEVDEESEIIQGSERARKRKVLDIVTFRHFNEIKDAEIALEGGWDKEKNQKENYQERYFVGITGGIYNDQTRMSFQATLDNFPGAQRISGYKFSRLGGRDSYNRNGEGKFNIEKSSSDLLKRFSIDYLYRNQYSDNQNNSINEYYPASSFDNQYQENVTQNSRDSKQHSLYFKGKFIQKNRHSIDFNLKAFLLDTEQENYNLNRMIRDSALLSLVERQNQSNYRRYNIGTKFDYKQNIKNIGAINLYLDASIGTSKSNASRTDATHSSGISNYKILDMNSKSPKKELNVKFFFNPAFDLFTLKSQLTYRDQDVHRMYMNRSSGLVDSLMSENISERVLDIRNEIDFNIYSGSKHILNVGMSHSIIKLWKNELFPKFWDEQKTFQLLNPKIFYEGVWGKTKANITLEIGQELIPSWSISDFSTRLNIDNPLFVRGGNPNLKIPNRYDFSFTLSLPYSLRYSLTDTYIQNGVVLSNTLFSENTYLPEYNYQILAGATLQRPINIDGYHVLKNSLSFSKMFGLVLSMKTSLGYTYSNPQAEYNGRIGRVKDQTGEWDLALNSNFSSTLFLTLRNKMSINRYTNADELTTKRFSNAISLNANWEVTYRFFIKSDYTYRHHNNSALDYNINEQILNASVGLKLFENHRGKLTFSAVDILNDQKNITTIANDMYVQTKHTFLNTSYFAVSFEYRLTNQ